MIDKRWHQGRDEGADMDRRQFITTASVSGVGAILLRPWSALAQTTTTVTVEAPGTDGQTISGRYSLSADTTDNGNVSNVLFFLTRGPQDVGETTQLTAYGWIVPFNTLALANGQWQVKARAYLKNGGYVVSSGRTFYINNSAPAVEVEAPAADGATVRRTYSLSASVLNLSSVTKVEFHWASAFGPIKIGETLAPGPFGWVVPWQTVTVANGLYEVTATAHHSRGTTTSARRRVAIENAVPVTSTKNALGVYIQNNRTGAYEDAIGIYRVSPSARPLGFELDYVNSGSTWDGWRASFLGYLIAGKDNPRKLVLTIPPFPQSEATLDALHRGSEGAFNDHYTWAGEQVAHQYGAKAGTHLFARFGHEVQSGHYPWGVKYTATPEKRFDPERARDFALLYRVAHDQMMNAVRRGGSDLKWAYNGMGSQKFSEYDAAYPGDNYVDLITNDLYQSGLYSYPRSGHPHAAANVDEAWNRAKLVFDEYVKYAAEHGKLWGIDETSTNFKWENGTNVGSYDNGEWFERLFLYCDAVRRGTTGLRTSNGALITRNLLHHVIHWDNDMTSTNLFSIVLPYKPAEYFFHPAPPEGLHGNGTNLAKNSLISRWGGPRD